MKKINIIYWTATIICAALMLASSIPDVMNVPDAVKFMSQLGYPPYFTPFIGWLKILGITAILVPGFPRLKEWAYAGLAFDLIGATYSQIAIGTPASGWAMMSIFFIPLIASYMSYHKRQQARLALATGM
jgi:uncharacterized membrane protein YphA (DoxX/SURF4 family)